MKYQIPEDTLPGTRPAWTAHHLVIMVTTILAGPLIGFLWAGVNGHLLGCRDMRRQWVVLAVGLVVATSLNVTQRWLAITAEPGSAAALADDILRSVFLITLIVTLIYIGDRQSVLHGLQTRKNKYFWGIPTGIGLFAVSLAIRGFVVPDLPLVRQAIGGMSLGII